MWWRGWCIIGDIGNIDIWWWCEFRGDSWWNEWVMFEFVGFDIRNSYRRMDVDSVCLCLGNSEWIRVLGSFKGKRDCCLCNNSRNWESLYNGWRVCVEYEVCILFFNGLFIYLVSFFLVFLCYWLKEKFCVIEK